MKRLRSIKVSEEFYNFLNKLASNRVKMDVDNKTKHLNVLPDIIVKYFKLNNNEYLELVKQEFENGN